MTFDKLNTILKWKELKPFVQPIEILVKKGFNHFEAIEFEQFVKNLIECFGFVGELTPITGDGGVDIIFKDKEDLIVVQCKKYNDNLNIGVQEIREFFGTMVHYNCKYGYFVTTSDFTEAAKLFAEGHTNMILINYKALERIFRLATLSVIGQLDP